VYDLPQPILLQLLTTLKTAPERLSASETEIAKRICICSVCTRLWVRRKAKLPDRCPGCHRRDWDRPLIAALLRAQPPPPITINTQAAQLPEKGETP